MRKFNNYVKEQTARTASTSSLKEAIDDLLNAYKIRGKYNETHVVASWSRLMGPAIANRTSKIYIKDKKLFVQINSAPLKNELAMSRSKIVEILNKDISEAIIEEVIFL
jgi:predicted nucleic acid-binding Zn ribbon protein